MHVEPETQELDPICNTYPEVQVSHTTEPLFKKQDAQPAVHTKHTKEALG